MYYAKQVDPASQESPLFHEFPDNIAVFGNRDYKNRIPDKIKKVISTLSDGEIPYYAEEKPDENPYLDVSELIKAYFPPMMGRPDEYTKEEESQLLSLAKQYLNTADTKEIIAAVLSIVTATKWKACQITGCAQSEWNNLIYPVYALPTREAVEAFETEYFNTGSEWIIDDGDFDPENDSPLIIDGERIYCTSTIYDDIRKEIAEYLDVPAEELTLYVFEGYYQIPHYKSITP